MQKYKLTECTIQHKGRKLHRIQALRGFSDVNADDIGGYVQSEHNLSHEGNAWIYDEAKVYDRGLVTDDAQVRDEAEIYDDGAACDHVKITEHARICGKGRAAFHAVMADNALLADGAKLGGYAQVKDNAKLVEKANVSGHMMVCGRAKVTSNIKEVTGAISGKRTKGSKLAKDRQRKIQVEKYRPIKRLFKR